MNVIIFYEHLTREWDAAQKLKAALEEKGARVRVFSIIFQRTAARVDAMLHHPDVIYLPWFSIKIHEQIIEPITRYSPHVVIINQHQEQIGSATSEKQLIPITKTAKNGVYHFAWGDHFEKLMLNNGVEPDMIRITGNIRNDAGKAKPVDRDMLASQYDLDPSKKWVLFAENRGWLSQRNTEATMNELMSHGATREYLENSLKYEQFGLRALVDDMWQLSDAFFDEFELIYRPHPGTQFHMQVPDKIHILSDRSIYDWICASSLFLTCESTSIFEADLCCIPCATLDHVSKMPENVMAGLSDYPKIDSLCQISATLISSLAEAQKTRQPIYSRYIGLVDGEACTRTVAETMKIIEKVHGRPVLERAPFSMNFRQFLFESITYLMTITGLLYKLRFPRSAYTESRDIPYSKKNKWIRS